MLDKFKFMITFYSFKDFQSLLVKESVCCQDYNLNIQLANAAYFNLMYSIESALNFSMNDSMRVKHNYFKVNRITYLSKRFVVRCPKTLRIVETISLER
jgi:hypothetical protein